MIRHILKLKLTQINQYRHTGDYLQCANMPYDIFYYQQQKIDSQKQTYLKILKQLKQYKQKQAQYKDMAQIPEQQQFIIDLHFDDIRHSNHFDRNEIDKCHQVKSTNQLDRQGNKHFNNHTSRRHKLTILLGSSNNNNNHQYPSRVSIKRSYIHSIDNAKSISNNKRTLLTIQAGVRQNTNSINNKKAYYYRKNKKQTGKLGGINKTNNSQCNNYDGVQLTQRKYVNNGNTTNLLKLKENSKSYRVHTIGYVEQDDQYNQYNHKFVKNSQQQCNLNSITSRKHNQRDKDKNKMKKKTIINQSDFAQFVTLNKNVNINKQREKQKDTGGTSILTGNLKHRKYNKIKTQLDHQQLQKQHHSTIKNSQTNKKQAFQCKKTQKYCLLSQRKCRDKQKQLSLDKKIQFKCNKIKNKIANIHNESRDTIDIKLRKQTITIKQNNQQTGRQKQVEKIKRRLTQQYQEKQNNNKIIVKNTEQPSSINHNFNKYLNFINKSKKQEKTSKAKIIKNLLEGRSMIVKNIISRETINLKQTKNQKNNQKNELNHENTMQNGQIKNRKCARKSQAFTTPLIDQEPNIKNFIYSAQKQPNKNMVVDIKSFLHTQFDFSAIPQVNQSSFLSESAKNQIILTNTFKLNQQTIKNEEIYSLKHPQVQEIKLQSINVLDSLSPQKNKKRKKQSKKSMICRSDIKIKQAFPDKFFI